MQLGHVMPLTLMLPSHDAISIVKETTTFLTATNENEEQCHFFDHVTQLPLHHMVPLVLVLHDAIGIHIRHGHHMMLMASLMASLHSLGQYY